MRKLGLTIDRCVGLVIDGLGALAGAVVAVIALSISAEVVLRSIGGRPFGWTLEMAEYGLLVIGFLGAPWVLRHGDHIRVDIVLRTVGEAWNRRLLLLANGIALTTCVFLAWYGYSAANEAFQRGSMLFKTIPMPQWIILSIMPIGSALLAYEFLARCIRGQDARPGDDDHRTAL
jgi:TRAP-type C4-dicarboxylate transport system permease small subunit